MGTIRSEVLTDYGQRPSEEHIDSSIDESVAHQLRQNLDESINNVRQGVINFRQSVSGRDIGSNGGAAHQDNDDIASKFNHLIDSLADTN